MKRIFTLLLAVTFAVLPSALRAQSTCYIPIAIYFDDQNMTMPQASVNVLQNALTRIATAGDFEGGLNFSQFVMTARVDVIDKSVHPGPPILMTQNLGITFFIGDTYTQTKFASAYVELDGVGQNETKCLTDAFKRINANNSQIQSLLQTGRKKIIAYYDKTYKTILADAEKAFGLQDYEQAIALAVSIPSCSKGGAEGAAAALRYYGYYRDRQNLQLLNKARMLWAAGQDIATAREVAALLSQIDPDAACYADALNLAKEVKAQVRSDIDFEMREKYHDQVALRKQQIEAARAVGVAWGKGQQPTTTNLMWLR